MEIKSILTGSPQVLAGAVIGTGKWRDVDCGWEQRKPEARKMLDAKRAAESHTSGARFVRRLFAFNRFLFARLKDLSNDLARILQRNLYQYVNSMPNK